MTTKKQTTVTDSTGQQVPVTTNAQGFQVIPDSWIRAHEGQFNPPEGQIGKDTWTVSPSGQIVPISEMSEGEAVVAPWWLATHGKQVAKMATTSGALSDLTGLPLVKAKKAKKVSGATTAETNSAANQALEAWASQSAALANQDQEAAAVAIANNAAPTATNTTTAEKDATNLNASGMGAVPPPATHGSAAQQVNQALGAWAGQDTTLAKENQEITSNVVALDRGDDPTATNYAAQLATTGLSPNSAASQWFQGQIAQANANDAPVQAAMDAYASAYQEGQAGVSASLTNMGRADTAYLAASPYAQYVNLVTQGLGSGIYKDLNPSVTDNLPIDLQYALYQAGVQGIQAPLGGWPKALTQGQSGSSSVLPTGLGATATGQTGITLNPTNPSSSG